MEYSKLSTHDTEDNTASFELDSGAKAEQFRQLGNFTSVPISRPPSQRRDNEYFVIFCIALLFLVFLSIITLGRAQGKLIPSKSAGNWDSMIMVAPLLGFVVGLMISVALYDKWLREIIFYGCIPFSSALKICVGNVFLMLTDLWYVALMLILSAAFDIHRIRKAKDSIIVSLSLVEMGLNSCDLYDTNLELTSLAMLVIQTCMSLWWSVILVSLLSQIGHLSSVILLFFMVLSIYWVSQFLQKFTGAIISGSLLWTFLRDSNTDFDENANATQISLYLKSCLTSSIGSICKAALLLSPSQAVLWMYVNLYDSPPPLATIPSTWHNTPIYILRNISIYLQPYAVKHHRLSVSHISTFGHTLCKSAQEQLDLQPDLIDLLVMDSTSFLLSSIGFSLSCTISIGLSLLATIEEKDVSVLWPLFFLCCFILSHAGVSLAMSCFQSAVDAMFVAYIDCPGVFAEKNAILYQRFCRISELEITSH